MAPRGQPKKKGESGAAKNYISRARATRKLQCTLADFRRLCILKGIFPREPKSRKKVNKGSNAPASFYYVKDIQYLLHEPVLAKLREHKAFAKKLSRALGRGQIGLAKNLDEKRPKYRIDHIIRERYPTFIDSIRDLDDALSLIILFAHLPASSKVPAPIVAHCARLANEWQLYVARTHSLRKVFLSIKGIYFQAEVMGQTVTWLVPYMFTQHVPDDVDFRVMLTFLELYQTLLGFVFYKLYTDLNLVYPPKLDEERDDAGGAGLSAFMLQETNRSLTNLEEDPAKSAAQRNLTTKDVKKQIKAITQTAAPEIDDEAIEPEQAEQTTDTRDVFTSHSKTDEDDVMLTLTDAARQQEETEAHASLFSNFVIYISREVTRPVLEFVIRSFSGQVCWDPILGAGSPFEENDERITHHVVDRPVQRDAAGQIINTYTQHKGRRVYVQPQWVVDCVNKKTLLPTDDYAPGQALPPHLSPFVNDKEVKAKGGYVPAEAGLDQPAAEAAVSESESEEEEEEEEGEADVDDLVEEAEEPVHVPAQKNGKARATPALLAAVDNPDDEALLRAAELEAETQGIPHAVFEANLRAAQKTARQVAKKTPSTISPLVRKQEGDASMLLTGKNRKIYKHMERGIRNRKAATDKLADKKRKLVKDAKKA
ncbi:uncharacterized protein L969DRAFT_53845 [Mixia osmundae IAM 14324]|uniref:Pescadillo homolog n=1 Tax=Mixia osmundae (strain CBS 9802 / IAM 14324 / JCM 22182 / KY 12970) TaxID=764103 RepID=G7DZG3_MIXOS|nr:uncharacterized protein L969DRAFT_53845 [Mixia osmundae IAM 14324]KEI37144.1 hypothetical protein L969DRAFT_53845 [Mixia osmundae IAM 14324]GAA95973.1 hypothetical protein E5Q_02631 [Mixia osmundae IAM 14324]